MYKQYHVCFNKVGDIHIYGICLDTDLYHMLLYLLYLFVKMYDTSAPKEVMRNFIMKFKTLGNTDIFESFSSVEACPI